MAQCCCVMPDLQKVCQLCPCLKCQGIHECKQSFGNLTVTAGCTIKHCRVSPQCAWPRDRSALPAAAAARRASGPRARLQAARRLQQQGAAAGSHPGGRQQHHPLRVAPCMAPSPAGLHAPMRGFSKLMGSCHTQQQAAAMPGLTSTNYRSELRDVSVTNSTWI
jgi:hypothetical protein